MRDKILEFVGGYIKEHGYSPSMREIGEAIGVDSTSHVSFHIDRLVEEGRLTKEPNIARSIRVVK